MGATVTAGVNGTQLPIDSLEIAITYDGDFVATMTVHYAGITYVQTYTNDGTHITDISQWIPQPPVVTYMIQESGGDFMVTEDGNSMIDEAA